MKYQGLFSQKFKKIIKQKTTTSTAVVTGAMHVQTELSYGKCPIISNTFLFLFTAKMLVIYKMLVRIANREYPDQTACQKQSDLGLQWLSRPFWQATSVLNFSKSTIPLVVHVA